MQNTLVLGIHNHQPAGNFDHVIEEAYRKAYRPFLSVLSEFPDIPITLHFTGILLDWLEEKHPDLLDLLRTMIAGGQVEMMTGGYYEPIMPIIPDRDKKGQIRKLSAAVEERLGSTPTGMWLAERVWEPHLTKPLAEAGVRYVAMDDSHFKAAGLRGHDLLGYYFTEEQGAQLAVFPISERLRYLIPFREPEETIDYLRETASEDPGRLLVMADDGEKFGVWPGTHEWVFEKGWLRRFFEALLENRSWLEVKTFRQILESRRSLGPIYVPNASYTEMMEWVLPAEQTIELENLRHSEESMACRPYLRGGFWRNYLVKYIESNNLHKKMLLVSERAESLGDGECKRRARELVWAGQCNCAYWHGVFGGLYLNHIRQAVYESLIGAEKEIDREIHSDGPWLSVEERDFLCEGGRCLLVEGSRLNAYFDLDRGGALFELDHKPKCFNLLNTMTRRPEAYHEKIRQAGGMTERPGPAQAESIHDLVILKEEGLERHLIYDTYRRSALIDHFLSPGETPEAFRTNGYEERGDFVDQPYTTTHSQDGSAAKIVLERVGWVRNGADRSKIRIRKGIGLRADQTAIDLSYAIRSLEGDALETLFGVEFGFALQAGNTPDRYYLFPDERARPLLGETGERRGLSGFSLVEEWIGIEVDIQLGKPFNLWYFPIDTVSSSEAGFERTFQSSVVLPHWKISLRPGDEWNVTGRLELKDRSE